MSGPSREGRAVQWRIISFVVVVLGIGGYLTVTLSSNTFQHTAGEALLTVALVAGPFLWAEALLSQPVRTTRRARPEMSTDLVGRDLTGVDLAGHYLRRRQMSAVRLSEADLGGADLTETRLDDARLTTANLTGARLPRASLKSAACYRADLRNADLTEADLRWANLKRADLRGACLVDADLRNADLRGTDLRETDLRGATLTGARYSRTTRLAPALADGAELARLGLMRHADEPHGDRTSSSRSWADYKPALRVAALAAVAALLILGIPALLPDDPTDGARVEGVSESRSYYRITGDGGLADVRYLDTDGALVEMATALPITVPVDDPVDELSIEVRSRDGGHIRCQIHRNGTVVSQAESNGPTGEAVCRSAA